MTIVSFVRGSRSGENIPYYELGGITIGVVISSKWDLFDDSCRNNVETIHSTFLFVGTGARSWSD